MQHRGYTAKQKANDGHWNSSQTLHFHERQKDNKEIDECDQILHQHLVNAIGIYVGIAVICHGQQPVEQCGQLADEGEDSHGIELRRAVRLALLHIHDDDERDDKAYRHLKRLALVDEEQHGYHEQLAEGLKKLEFPRGRPIGSEEGADLAHGPLLIFIFAIPGHRRQCKHANLDQFHYPLR